METTKHGFNKRPMDLPKVLFYCSIIAIALALCFFFFVGISAIRKHNSYNVLKIDSTSIKSDTVIIFERDTALFQGLHDELVKREGFSDTVYSDKKGYHYIGYGHKVNYNSDIVITKKQASDLLWNDIFIRWDAVKLHLKKDIESHVFGMFVSGNKHYKGK